jgi:hypothetical protein
MACRPAYNAAAAAHLNTTAAQLSIVPSQRDVRAFVGNNPQKRSFVRSMVERAFSVAERTGGATACRTMAQRRKDRPAIRLRRALLTQPGRCRRHLATIPNHAMHSLHSAEHTAAPRRAPGGMPKYCIADRILAVVVAHAPLILSVSPMEFELLTPVWHVERFVKHIRALHGSAERPPENGGFQHR